MIIVGIETVIVFAAGAATIIGIILAVRVFVEIIEVRDRRRARYRAVRSEGQGGPPDITSTDHSVKLAKAGKGFRLDFYDRQGHYFYSVALEKVDSSVDR